MPNQSFNYSIFQLHSNGSINQHIFSGKAKKSEEELAEGVGGIQTSSSSYKRDKASKEKASANSSHNWNTLFLGASAVADLMADKYGVDKKDVVLGR